MPRGRKVSQKEVREGLRRLAFGEIKDAVLLLYENEEEILSRLDGLDLFNVSEIKKPKGGGTEIKFFDRFRAIDKLSELAESEERKNACSIYEALERSAAGTCGEEENE